MEKSQQALDHLWRAKWNWFGQIFRSNDSIAKQAYQWKVDKATEEHEDQNTPGKKIWKKKCEQWSSVTTGERRRQKQ